MPMHTKRTKHGENTCVLSKNKLKKAAKIKKANKKKKQKKTHVFPGPVSDDDGDNSALALVFAIAGFGFVLTNVDIFP